MPKGRPRGIMILDVLIKVLTNLTTTYPFRCELLEESSTGIKVSGNRNSHKISQHGIAAFLCLNIPRENCTIHVQGYDNSVDALISSILVTRGGLSQRIGSSVTPCGSSQNNRTPSCPVSNWPVQPIPCNGGGTRGLVVCHRGPFYAEGSNLVIHRYSCNLGKTICV